jgi:hypothetical protein
MSIPADIRALTFGEHLVVWGFRAFVIGRGECPVVQRAFEEACAPMGREALNAYAVFVQQLAYRGRRKIIVARPGCFGLTTDEQLVLALFAAAQAGAHDRLEAHLTWLLARLPVPPLAAAVGLIAQALAFNGHGLREIAVEPARPEGLLPGEAMAARCPSLLSPVQEIADARLGATVH